MTSLPVERPGEANDWFLIGAENRSAVRIRDGLIIGEDEQGGFQIAKPGTPEAWLKFGLEDGVLVIRVVARQWALRGDKGPAGPSARLLGPAHLELPNHRLVIGSADGSAVGVEDPTYRLVERYSINWLKPTPVAAPVSAPARSASAMDSIPEPIPEPSPAERSLPQPNLPLARPQARQGTPDTVRPQAPRPAQQREAVQPAPHRPVAARGRVVASRRRTASRRDPMSWSTLCLAIAIYLTALGFSAPVATPVSELATQNTAFDWSSFDATAGAGLLEEVESLLKGRSPPDRATLEFAIEAYRLAEQRGEGDFSARRAALERRLAARSDP